MDNEKIYDEIKKRSKDGQIGCKQCFEVAQCCKVNLEEVGRMCNEKKIKIRFCQLGCFE